MQDAAVALRRFLLSDAAVGEHVGERVYVDDLPAGQNEYMPRAAVVLRSAGGEELLSYNLNMTARIDVLSFGATRYEAGEVDRAVTEALHYLRREVVESTLLHSVVVTGGPNSFKAADTGWPVKMRTVVVRASMKKA
jgi:hypothetical protein